MVHIMMDYRDEKGVHICPHPTSLGQRCLYNIQAVVFWLEGVIRHESISCVCKYFMLLQRRNGFMRSGVRRRQRIGQRGGVITSGYTVRGIYDTSFASFFQMILYIWICLSIRMLALPCSNSNSLGFQQLCIYSTNRGIRSKQRWQREIHNQ